ncbi:hypothetical protein CIT31_13055 [Mesorhizobium wenxiniae]|uniref:Uncharacterized protein n=1 Tax=Mesorhizobium wenxiniae TaxID=2014805 RepID=A0A271KGQ9_9HYPH|nr:hypothetical protein CIT31_13055 [Mesorhizobium wenxiniae]
MLCQEINLTPEAKHGSQMWGGFLMDSLITDANDVTLAFEDYKWIALPLEHLCSMRCGPQAEKEGRSHKARC